MATIVIFELDTDPIGSATSTVIGATTVDIIDDDGTLEALDATSEQFDTSAFGDFVGDSQDTQIFESYDGVVAGNPVTFTLIQFSGSLYMFVNDGVIVNGSNITGIVAGPNPAPNEDFNTLSDFVCFCTGTEIATPNGPRPVETLQAGDLVNVLGKRPQRLRWIGSRKLSRTNLVAKPQLAPVRISAHSFGFNAPSKDIYVSPQHGIALQGMKLDVMFGHQRMLCPSVALANDRSITQEHDCDGVEYWHLLFDEHELLDTHGLWSESFYPGPTALSEMPRTAIYALHALFPKLKYGVSGYGCTALPTLTKKEGALLKNCATALTSGDEWGRVAIEEQRNNHNTSAQPRKRPDHLAVEAGDLR